MFSCRVCIGVRTDGNHVGIIRVSGVLPWGQTIWIMIFSSA